MSFEYKEQFTYTNIRAGLISGLFLTLVVLSFANFIFAEDLKPFLPLGFGIILFSSMILLLTINFFSSMRGVVAYPFAVVCVFLATILRQISQNPLVIQENLWVTTFVVIVVTTLSLSMSTFIASYFKLGNAVRYIPFPVIAGILSAIGCLMILKSIRSVTDEVNTLSGLINFFSPELLPQAAAALALAFFLLWKQKRIMPPALKCIGYTFFSLLIALVITQGSFSNWLIQVENIGVIWPPINFTEPFDKVPYSILVQFIPELLALNIVFVMSLLINMNGVEAFLKKDVDLNRELKITSCANLLTALLGGIGGCMTATQTIPNIKNGAICFSAALVAASVVFVSMVIGSLGYFYYIPKFLLAAIPIYLGSMFLFQWLYESKSKLTSYFEWGILLTTLLTAVLLGLVYGVFIGIIGASALFIYNYSYHDLIMEIKAGKKIRTITDRSKEEEQLLNDLYKQVLIVKLNGFLFFGNSYTLLNFLKKSITHGTFNSIKYMIVDFSMISNLDSSFLLMFVKIKEILKEKKITLCLCGIKDEIIQYIAKDSSMALFHSEEEALEWIEGNYLRSSPANHSKTSYITEYLDFLKPLFKTVQIKQSELVLKENTNSNSMYIVLKGTMRVFKTFSDGSQKTLRKMTNGTLVGELSYFLGTKTFASVVAEEDCELLVLSRERLEQLSKEEPEKMNTIYKLICVIMSDRIIKLRPEYRKINDG